MALSRIQNPEGVRLLNYPLPEIQPVFWTDLATLHFWHNSFETPVYNNNQIKLFQGILEPFSKVLSYAIQTNVLKYNCLMEICYLCNRAFTKVPFLNTIIQIIGFFLQERDKLILSRMVVYELVQALKFKTTIPDSNLLMLINLILQVKKLFKNSIKQN